MKSIKSKYLAALVMAAAVPAALFASSSTDSKIVDAAKASYNYRTVLDNRVSISSDAGIVTLTGTVQDRDDKTLAEDTVRNLPGVVSVDNKIQVQSAIAEHSDGWIALKVRGQLLMCANVSAVATKVNVKDGVVTLTGVAENAAQKELTAVDTKDVSDVRSVVNNLTIASSSSSTRQTTTGEIIDDASITAQVKYALLSHSATSAIKTGITTRDGVVAVTGEATTDAEKALVTQLAKDIKGVKSVSNDMTIKL